MITREPAIAFGALGEIAKAVVPVLVIGGFVHWDDKMVAAVMFLIGVVVTSLSVMFVRSQTVTTDTANRQIQTAIDQPSGTTVQKVIDMTKARSE